MTDKEMRAAATRFAADWSGKGYEKGQSQPFWMSLLRDVYRDHGTAKWLNCVLTNEMILNLLASQ